MIKELAVFNIYDPSPQVRYKEHDVDAFAVKYPFGTNVIISSVPGNNGKQFPNDVFGAFAPAVALVAFAPNPKNATTVPELMMRY